MSTALQKITAEAKRIKKNHPNKHRKYSGYQKEAAAKYRAGTIGKRKSAPRKKKHKAKKRKRASPRKRVAAVGKVKTTRRKKRTVHRKRPHRRKGSRRMGAVKRRRSSGSGGISTNKLLLLGGLAFGAYMLFKPAATTTKLPAGAPPLVTTTNPVRNNQANDILAYATAGGLAIDAILKLIDHLNSQPDGEVQDIYDNIKSGYGIPSDILA